MTWLFSCPFRVRRDKATLPVGASPQTIQPEAAGAAKEVTNWLKLGKRSRIGDSARGTVLRVLLRNEHWHRRDAIRAQPHRDEFVTADGELPSAPPILATKPSFQCGRRRDAKRGVLLAPAFCAVAIVGAHRESPNLGKPVASGEIADATLILEPDGAALPAGSGTSERGATILRRQVRAMS
jgi:hypothetical protein